MTPLLALLTFGKTDQSLLQGVNRAISAAGPVVSVRVISPVIESVGVTRYLLSRSATVMECGYRYHSPPYSVRWYKNGKEFYSYVLDKPRPQSVHPVAGITVDLSTSNQSQVSLLSVSRETTGRFRCEVSGAAPVFPTDTAYADLLVVEEPLSGPLITGNLPSYNLGDTVRLNCSLAVREANLTWYVNGHKVRQRLAERRLKEIFR